MPEEFCITMTAWTAPALPESQRMLVRRVAMPPNFRARNQSAIACFITCPFTMEMKVVRGMPLGQIYTQFCA